uniref:G-protein coupled receptors family 1 profile domain-containing protein n=1 Tax=Dendroctonus ponderosae TaxID=77166 RepID=A0AAR5Q878_DENPD
MNSTTLQNQTINDIFSNTTNISSSWKHSMHFFAGNGACSEWIMYTYLSVLFLGSCVNLLECVALLRSKKNGLLCIVFQIALADLLLFFIALLELLNSYHQSWRFSSQSCMIYKGTEMLTNTSITYLLICLNFHIVTFWNLYNVELVKNNRNPLTSFNDSSSECLVTRNENRIVNIDYQKRKNDVPVILPVIFLWILCLSISMPTYVLSSTVQVRGKTLCILANNYGAILQSLLLVFSTTLPCFLLIVSMLILIYKLFRTSGKDIDRVLTKQFEEIRNLLIFGIVFTIFYIIISYQRHVLNMFSTVRQFFVSEMYYINFPNVYLTMMHYSGVSFRGLLCYLALPSVREAVRKHIFFCTNKIT